jgi:enamine deaminase RidA (YjgF/YER057c/UK114 family)
VVEAGGARHLFLSGITGGIAGDRMAFPGQASAMLMNSEEVLAREGFSFRDVIRTWIYLKDIDSQYSDLNACRRAFFTSHQVRPAPASTGIRGAVHPPDRTCGLDLRAISHDGRVKVRPIHAPTMNEAPVYGSDFSRGTCVTIEDRTVLYISGTASIDTTGHVIAPGDIEGQVDRMLVNVKALLEGQGAGWGDLVSAVTYLKRPEYRETFLRVCGRHGLPERIPSTTCVADICRPEWLCEMEAIAVMV